VRGTACRGRRGRGRVMRTTNRFLLGVVASVLPTLVAVSCMGTARGGSDSETHFFCEEDRACWVLGRNYKCVHRHCQLAATVTSDASEASPPTDDPITGNPIATDSSSRVGTPRPVRDASVSSDASFPPGSAPDPREAATVEPDVAAPWDTALASPLT